jgi:hypothetical protein
MTDLMASNDSFRRIQNSLDNMQEIFLMAYLRDEYNQEIYGWYDFDVKFLIKIMYQGKCFSSLGA